MDEEVLKHRQEAAGEGERRGGGWGFLELHHTHYHCAGGWKPRQENAHTYYFLLSTSFCLVIWKRENGVWTRARIGSRKGSEAFGSRCISTFSFVADMDMDIDTD
jgi:hypothetical protein